jgi:hypothetical protein
MKVIKILFLWIQIRNDFGRRWIRIRNDFGRRWIRIRNDFGRHWIRIRIDLVGVGSGSAMGMRIQEGKNDPQ